jgi:hypothetical protein
LYNTPTYTLLSRPQSSRYGHRPHMASLPVCSCHRSKSATTPFLQQQTVLAKHKSKCLAVQSTSTGGHVSLRCFVRLLQINVLYYSNTSRCITHSSVYKKCSIALSRFAANCNAIQKNTKYIKSVKLSNTFVMVLSAATKYHRLYVVSIYKYTLLYQIPSMFVCIKCCSIYHTMCNYCTHVYL